MARPLKVYRTVAGFHDAYVAATSQKAALDAWGSDKDLFARGDAELVEDPALTAEPLASPGVVIRRSRGSADEQMAALPPSRPRRVVDQNATADARPARAAPAPKTPPPPKPSPEDLAMAEDALAVLEHDQRRALSDLEAREAALAHERQTLERTQGQALDSARTRRDEEQERYDRALARWKARSR